MSKIAIFVDVQNIYYTTRQAYGRQFNYRKFWAEVSSWGEVVIANAYAIARDDDGQIKFQDMLRHLGFEVKLKPYIQRHDGSAKGDWDVGITLDVMSLAPEVDQVILLSGDGDFDLLLERVRKDYGVKTTVFSVPALTAKSLIQASDVHREINTALLL